MTTEQVAQALAGTLWEVNPETYTQIRNWLNEGFDDADHGQPLQHSGATAGDSTLGVQRMPQVSDPD